MRSTTHQEIQDSAFAGYTPERAPAGRFNFFHTLLGGFLIFGILLLALATSYQMRYSGKIYPGVSVAGLDLAGLTVFEATDRIAQQVEFPLDGRIAFQDSATVWMASPLELGLYLDAESSARHAYNIGREGNLLKRIIDQFWARTQRTDYAPYFVYDESRALEYLERIASQVDQPVVEASLGLNGVEVDVRSGQVGRSLDIRQTLSLVGPQLESMKDGIINLAVTETPPVILNVEEQAALAREILSEPLRLVIENSKEGDPGPWTFDPQVLASMLTIEKVQDQGAEAYQVALDTSKVRVFLEGIAPELESTARDARFIFNDETGQIDLLEPAVIGRRLLVNQTSRVVNESLAAGEHTVALNFETVQPRVTDNATAAELGITELVNSETSYFYGSSAPRIQNIQTAASRFHGLLVAPGETFSMAQALGDVSLDNGYEEALIIFGDRTIKGVGGGVCQVSTTLFRNVFFAGFPIVERHPHAYRVYYYELTAGNSHDASLAGLDATVFVPLVDFTFVNDTASWLLMETYVNPAGSALTWKFYSTSDGRRVEWSSTGLQNRVEAPPPLYQENPDLEKGEIRQVDWAVEGADVTVHRSVLKGDTTYLEDQFITHYLPWRAVYEYGPGTEDIPDPESEEG
jgi:vancomycin resistance protein YoaR